MKPQKEYKEGLIWIGEGNPLGARKGYYSQKQIDNALQKADKNTVVRFLKFMEK